MWQDSIDFHQQRQRDALLECAHRNVFSRKLLVFLARGAIEPSFYCDSDVLWFDGPPPIPHANGGCRVQLMQDNVPSYDRLALAELQISELADWPPLNSGVVFLDGDILGDREQGPFLCRYLEHVRRRPVNFTDQTLLALAARRLGFRPWGPSQIALFTTDKYVQLWPRYYPHFEGWMARHYVGPIREYFWRDCLLLRATELRVRQARANRLLVAASSSASCRSDIVTHTRAEEAL
jgi:hypothetical protein